MGKNSFQKGCAKVDKQVIFVGGKRFTVITNESEAYMKKITDRIDTKLKSIMSSNPSLDKDSAAILASLDYCDEEYKLRDKLKTAKKQIKEYLEDSANLHNQIKELKMKNMELESNLEKILNVNMPKESEKNPKEKKIVATGKIEKNVPTIIDGAVQQSLFDKQ